VGRNPQDITWAADGRFAYVANVGDNTVSVISADDLAGDRDHLDRRIADLHRRAARCESGLRQ